MQTKDRPRPRPLRGRLYSFMLLQALAGLLGLGESELPELPRPPLEAPLEERAAPPRGGARSPFVKPAPAAPIEQVPGATDDGAETIELIPDDEATQGMPEEPGDDAGDPSEAEAEVETPRPASPWIRSPAQPPEATGPSPDTTPPRVPATRGSGDGDAQVEPGARGTSPDQPAGPPAKPPPPPPDGLRPQLLAPAATGPAIPLPGGEVTDWGSGPLGDEDEEEEDVQYAGIVGTVKDKVKGDPLADVEVSLPELDLRALTDKRGQFMIRGIRVRERPYELLFQAPSFQNLFESLKVETKGTRRLDFELTPQGW